MLAIIKFVSLCVFSFSQSIIRSFIFSQTIALVIFVLFMFFSEGSEVEGNLQSDLIDNKSLF